MTAPAAPPAAPRPPRGRILTFLARIASWPLSLFLLAIGALVQTVRLAIEKLRGEEDAGRNWTRYVTRALGYLTFRTTLFPPLVGRVPDEAHGRGPWWETRRRLSRDRIAMASWIGICFYLYVALAAATGVLAADWAMEDRKADYLPPTLSLIPFEVGEHPFGTDLMGREVWKVTVHGTKNALWIGTFAALLACIIGLTLGSIAGYFGRWIDELIVWFYATLQSIPYLLLMLAMSFVFQKNVGIRDAYEAGFLSRSLNVSLGLFTIVVAVGLTFWVGVCRVVRAEFMKLRDRDFVVAARSLGIPTHRVIFKHVAPNVFHLVLIQFSLLFMAAIKFEVILSFLGVGMDPGAASWGQMINQAKLELMRSDPVWWQITAATAAMFGLLLCVNLFTDALRDALDPRLRN